MCPVKLSLDCELNPMSEMWKCEKPVYLTESIKYGIVDLGSSWRVLFSFEPVLQLRIFPNSRVWKLKGLVDWTGRFQNQGWGKGWAGNRFLGREG